MTAVVGILNKRGIAIAADSAVTMSRGRKGEKIANSANKMLRLTSANPISVMVTGSASLLGVPWDVIIRRYRQKRGNNSFPTVQACVNDFFSYIPTEPAFFEEDMVNRFLGYLISEFYDTICRDVPEKEYDDDGNVTNEEEVFQVMNNAMRRISKKAKTVGTCQQFVDYDFERFIAIAKDTIDQHFKEITADDIPGPEQYSSGLTKKLRPIFDQCFYDFTMARPIDGTTLVFSGYGESEEYPVLLHADVDGGFDKRTHYYIFEDEIVKISDDNPTAICPFAQADVMMGLLTGITPRYNREAINIAEESLSNYLASYINTKDNEGSPISPEIKKKLSSIKYNDLIRKFAKQNYRLRISERKQWLKTLHDYDLQDMARLAENLITITSFERHMTFSQEGVGGPIDLAVITKNNGFTWLNRKSWYHHKDVGGRYGKFGV